MEYALCLLFASLFAGVAVSTDGISWQRGSGLIEGARGAAKEEDVGAVLRPNGDWWTCDTAGLAVADVQVGRALVLGFRMQRLWGRKNSKAWTLLVWLCLMLKQRGI